MFRIISRIELERILSLIHLFRLGRSANQTTPSLRSKQRLAESNVTFDGIRLCFLSAICGGGRTELNWSIFNSAGMIWICGLLTARFDPD